MCGAGDNDLEDVMRFNFRTAKAVRAAVCINLRGHTARVTDGRIQLDIGGKP